MSTNRRNARLFVGDTGGLMNDVAQAARRGYLTSLLVALHLGSALLYVPRHVLIEIERDLPEYALKLSRPVAPERAMHCWRTWYAPCIRVVEVPDEWGANDPRVAAVGARHDPNASPDKFSDAPTARLALALADCFVVCRDDDLTDHSFGQHEHLELMHAVANEGEKSFVERMTSLPVIGISNLLEATVYGFRRLPPVGQVGVTIGAATFGYLWHRNGRAARQLKHVGGALAQLLFLLGPVTTEIDGRLRKNEPVWGRHVVKRDLPASIGEQVARILARAPDTGMLANEIADELTMSGSLGHRIAAVRGALRDGKAFTEVSRGRWRLGESASETHVDLSSSLIWDWIMRAHRGVIASVSGG